jgi:hypothetical protein
MSELFDGRKDEMTIVERLSHLRKELTKELAIQLCENYFLESFVYHLYDADHLHYECALQMYINLLQDILPSVPRSKFLRLFSKSCSGCASLTFLCILYLHPVFENDVYHLFRQLLFDVNGDILTRRDICQLALWIRQAYKRTDFRFPYEPNCLNFNRDNEALQKTFAIGDLFSSDRFCALMKTNPTIGARIAHEMFMDLGNDFHRSFHLDALLSKYDASSQVQPSE